MNTLSLLDRGQANTGRRCLQRWIGLGCSVLGLSALSAQAQHAHLNAGAYSTEQGAQLYFVNGANFVTNSGYVVSLSFTNAGVQAGLYQGGITFTALPATINTGGPAFGHAALGSFLELEMVSLEGPEDGELGFWEFGDAAPRFTLDTGDLSGTNRFDLSEGEGLPGDDPYGHIHGRSFTASRAGLYSLGVRLLDRSRNGTGGGPIHTPSELFHLHFQAGLTIARWSRLEDRMQVSFGTHPGHSYYLERTSQLGEAASWTTVAGPVAGNDHLQTLEDGGATNAPAFYRLRRTTP